MSNGNTSLLKAGSIPQGARIDGLAGTVITLDLDALEAVKAPETPAGVKEAPSTLKTDYKQYATTKITTQDVQLERPIICWDCETTGTEPWNYSWLVATFWDLQEPKSSMVTFASWNEEELTREVAEYLNSLDQFDMTGFNVAFDIRCMASRFMAYQIPVNNFMKAKMYDTRDFLKKGQWSNVWSDQASGSLEDWIVWLYDEQKPYTIEECFTALKEENLEPLIIRNRWDVGVEGDIFLLSKFVETSVEKGYYQMKPTMYQRKEEIAEGNVVVSCPICKTFNEYDLKNESQVCYVCQGKISRPIASEYLQEVMREVIMPKEKKATAK